MSKYFFRSLVFAGGVFLISLVLLGFRPHTQNSISPFSFLFKSNQAWAAVLPQLPRKTVDTSYTSRPCTTTVNAGGNLQNVINSAKPGDVICLQAGATFGGGFSLPVKSTSDSQWITIRSTRADELPVDKRVRPSDAAKLAKIVTPSNTPAINVLNSAHHYRLVGLEITAAGRAGNIVRIGDGSTQTQDSYLPHHIIIDRSYIHGATTTSESSTGVSINANYVAVIDSYISEIHRYGHEAMAILVVNSRGPIKVQNNYLESAGINFLVGGGDPKISGLVTEDIEFRGNHVFKRPEWQPYASKGSANNPYLVKNLFELKYGRYVLIEDNVFENNWPNGQDGEAILFHVKNQSGGYGDFANTAHVTFRYNIVKNVTSGISFGRICAAPAVPGHTFHIHNNLFEKLGAYSSGVAEVFILECPTDDLIGSENVTIEHNTIASPLRQLTYLRVTTKKNGQPLIHKNFVLRNNILTNTLRTPGYVGTDDQLNQLLPQNVFQKNVVVGSGGQTPYTNQNFYPGSYSGLFVNSNSGDYRLAASSPYKNAGTDGKDIGVDVSLLNQRTAGVTLGSYDYQGLPPVSPGGTQPPSVPATDAPTNIPALPSVPNGPALPDIPNAPTLPDFPLPEIPNLSYRPDSGYNGGVVAQNPPFTVEEGGGGGLTGGLVPCGRLNDDPSTAWDERKPCETCDVLVLLSRVINFILFTLVPAIAVLLYLTAGFMIIFGGANRGMVATGTNIFRTTTYSLFIIFGAWLLTNTALRMVAGDYLDQNEPWYVVRCKSSQLPGGGGGDGGGNGGGGSAQKYSCDSQGQCVTDPNGSFSSSDCNNTCQQQSVTKYTCNINGQCVEYAGGKYTNPNCDDLCQDQTDCSDIDSNGILDERDCGAPENENCLACKKETFSITTLNLNDAIAGKIYAQPVNHTGGTNPATYSIKSGSLPNGLSMSGNGIISGTPTAIGVYNFTVRAEDSSSPKQSAERQFTVRVTEATNSVTISDVASGNITSNSATITWTTDKPSTSQVEYGTSQSFGSSTTLDNSQRTSHSVNLAGLTPNTTYYYRAKSSVTGFTAVSSTNTFKTAVVAPTLSITTTSLPDGAVNQNYSQTLQATGGKTPYSWSKTAGNLPPGLNFSANGIVTGTPATAGTYTFTIKVEDSSSPKQSVTKQLSVKVNPAAALACVYNGTDYATFNLCTGQRRSSCGTSLCSQYLPSINRYAGGAASVNVLKTFMVVESDCNIKAGTSSSYGLMQLRPDTANAFTDRCPIQQDQASCVNAGGSWEKKGSAYVCKVTPNWLKNPINADKSICIGAAFINSIAAGTCGSQPRNIYAGYNAGPGNCAPSSDCVSDKSCDGGVMKRWECPYDNPQHTVCNTRMYETKQGATYTTYCLNNLGF